MRKSLVVGCLLLGLLGVRLGASGRIGIYGVIEKVVFEPSSGPAERVQVWGAFAFADGGVSGATPAATSSARRGYLYFTTDATGSALEAVRNEWTDLSKMAGTAQGVAFGNWYYVGQFAGMNTDTPTAYVLYMYPGGNRIVDMRVRPSSEAPEKPALYTTNAGVIKLTAEGSHAAIVKELKELINKK